MLPREAIEADYESVFANLRATYGKGDAPRTVNFITGPSRSADIEQTLLLGAHGPRRLHIVVVGWPKPEIWASDFTSTAVISQRKKFYSQLQQTP